MHAMPVNVTTKPFLTKSEGFQGDRTRKGRRYSTGKGKEDEGKK